VFAIGDTIYTGSIPVAYPGIPSFSPECFAHIRNPNPSTYKKFNKGLEELLDEGAVQLIRERCTSNPPGRYSCLLYIRSDDGVGYPILAAVGQLQFDVVQFRLKREYGVESLLDPLNYNIARWSNGGWAAVDKANAGKIPLISLVVVRRLLNTSVVIRARRWQAFRCLHGQG
jgi:peptide chain release factor 3